MAYKEMGITEGGKRMNEWKFLSVSATMILPKRLSILWNYVILGRKPDYTLEAWVQLPDKIADVSLRLVWKGGK